MLTSPPLQGALRSSSTGASYNRELLATAPLPTRKVLDIAAQFADGLGKLTAPRSESHSELATGVRPDTASLGSTRTP